MRKEDRLEEVIKLFKQIKEISSINNKKAIITANKGNELFKKCLRFLLDGNIVTGISDKKLNKKILNFNFAEADVCHSFEEVMSYLEKNNSGRDYDICAMQLFLKTVPDDDREFYKQMITKKIKLGADKKVVNTCIPNLIPTFDVMLGTSIEHCKIPEGIWFSLSHKLNGNRCTYYDGELYTRQGKKIFWTRTYQKRY